MKRSMRNQRTPGHPAPYVMASVRSRAAPELTSRKRSSLYELARAMARAREEYLHEYWGPRFAMAAVLTPHRLVEMRRRTGWAVLELSPHQNKIAMESALG